MRKLGSCDRRCCGAACASCCGSRLGPWCPGNAADSASHGRPLPAYCCKRGTPVAIVELQCAALPLRAFAAARLAFLAGGHSTAISLRRCVLQLLARLPRTNLACREMSRVGREARITRAGTAPVAMMALHCALFVPSRQVPQH